MFDCWQMEVWRQAAWSSLSVWARSLSCLHVSGTTNHLRYGKIDTTPVTSYLLQNWRRRAESPEGPAQPALRVDGADLARNVWRWGTAWRTGFRSGRERERRIGLQTRWFLDGQRTEGKTELSEGWELYEDQLRYRNCLSPYRPMFLIYLVKYKSQNKKNSIVTVWPRGVPAGEGPGHQWENLPGHFPPDQRARGWGPDQQVPLRRGGDPARLHQSDQRQAEWSPLEVRDCVWSQPIRAQYLNWSRPMRVLHSADRDAVVLDFHHPSQITKAMDFSLPDSGLSLDQLVVDCRAALR